MEHCKCVNKKTIIVDLPLKALVFYIGSISFPRFSVNIYFEFFQNMFIDVCDIYCFS